MKLYTYEIDIDTLATQANEQEEDEYNEEDTGYAEYEKSYDGGRVYSESLESAFDAKCLVFKYLKKI